jgi:hypothetical protein
VHMRRRGLVRADLTLVPQKRPLVAFYAASVRQRLEV